MTEKSDKKEAPAISDKELERYMGDQKAQPDRKAMVAELRTKYAGVLQQQKEVLSEIELYQGDEPAVKAKKETLRANLTERKRVVVALRRLGEKVEDPFVE